MNRQETYLQSLRDTYPEFPILSVRYNGYGQNNDVLIINEVLIFRFPKYTHAIKKLKIETAILTEIQDDITLEIPNPTFQNLESLTVGQTFVGYPLITGEPLWQETLYNIHDDKTLDCLAAQLANFLKELHSVPITRAFACELPVYDLHDEWADLYSRIQNKLFPYMRLDARDWAVSHFEKFLSHPGNFKYQPVLKHGDFGTSNILFDTKTQTINGVIDFGGVGLGDPAYDFAGILSSYGESFLQRFQKTYPKIESFWERIWFYKGTFALLEALFGIENNDQEAFESGIEAYKK